MPRRSNRRSPGHASIARRAAAARRQASLSGDCQARTDPILQLMVEVGPREPERLRSLRPKHQDRLRAARQDSGGGAAAQQAGPEARDGPRDRIDVQAHAKADARADRAADDAAEQRAEVDHGVDQQGRHDIEQVGAGHHAVRDPSGRKEGHAPHGTLNIRPLAEELEDVADARHDALKHQQEDASEGVSLLLRIHPGLAYDRFHSAYGSYQE
mmetsp:Transcript_25861/g.38780  ORF Transcript_25861/g.38780 Transcript_25861/m.38780 type:complete len:213 (+) Transcript_25861:183-821(+)